MSETEDLIGHGRANGLLLSRPAGYQATAPGRGDA